MIATTTSASEQQTSSTCGENHGEKREETAKLHTRGVTNPLKSLTNFHSG
jgi:hypothetical protein